MTTFAQDADGRRLAARSLLLTPILTAARQPDEFALVRRHAIALQSMFATQLGYQLVVESTFARLVKAPLEPYAPVRPARRGDTELAAAGYVVLALVCAALLAPGVGEQILISGIVDQLRADAAEQGLEITDGIADRRRIVAAVAVLVSWGVLSETDGSVSAWGERRAEEALLTIDRSLLAHLLPSPLHQHDDVRDLWAPPADDQPRRRLRRRLVENPVVFRTDLGAAEQDVLSRERSELTRQLEENFGLTLEVRAEGALAYDASAALTDVEFPGNGSLKQAALLLLDALVAAPSHTIVWADVNRLLTELLAGNRKAWRKAYVASPDELRADVVALLASLSLVTPTGDGLVVHAPAARYRASVRRVAVGQPDLFEEAP